MKGIAFGGVVDGMLFSRNAEGHGAGGVQA